MAYQDQRPPRQSAGGRHFKTARGTYSTRTPRSRKYPPFGRQLALNPPKKPVSIIVCTGSGAWERAKATDWMHSAPKLVLPLSEDPADFRWPVAGYDCMLFGFGKLEPYPRIVALARELLAYEALFVITCFPHLPVHKFERGSQ